MLGRRPVTNGREDARTTASHPSTLACSPQDSRLHNNVSDLHHILPPLTRPLLLTGIMNSSSSSFFARGRGASDSKNQSFRLFFFWLHRQQHRSPSCAVRRSAWLLSASRVSAFQRLPTVHCLDPVSTRLAAAAVSFFADPDEWAL